MKLYRFFYHFNKPRKTMSVHFRGKCYMGKYIDCYEQCSTKWNKKQPFLIMRGWARDVHINKDGVIIIE